MIERRLLMHEVVRQTLSASCDISINLMLTEESSFGNHTA